MAASGIGSGEIYQQTKEKVMAAKDDARGRNVFTPEVLGAEPAKQDEAVWFTAMARVLTFCVILISFTLTVALCIRLFKWIA